MLQNLEGKGLLPQEMQPYLMYYNSNDALQKADFIKMPKKEQSFEYPVEPASTFILPPQHDTGAISKPPKRSTKKKSLHFDNKRSTSVHTSISSETRFLDFQGDKCITHEHSKFCEALDSKPGIRKSFNRLDLVMRDVIKEEAKAEGTVYLDNGSRKNEISEPAIADKMREGN